MTWSVDAAVQVQNLISRIGTRLTGGGWTAHDAANNVYRSVNNQGVTQYLQLIEGGTYQYIQLEGWLSWDAGTHTGTSGSGTTWHRVYFAVAAQAGTVTVDLYMSVTANRVIIYIQGVGNYRNWGYFGGLDSLAGTNDPGCAVLTAAYEQNGSYNGGVILQPNYFAGAYWSAVLYWYPMYRTNGVSTSSQVDLSTISADGLKTLLLPVVVGDGTGHYVRGNLDGIFMVPGPGGNIVHLDTVVVSGITYLVVIPGGETLASTHPITQNYVDALALAEV